MEGNGSRYRIRQALFSLLEEWPIERITVSEVASRAHVSRTTYYRLYDSLEDVVNDTLDDLFSSVEPLIPQEDETSEHGERLIELATFQILCCYKREMELLNLLMRGSLGTMLHYRLFEFVLSLIRKHSRKPQSDPTIDMEQVYVAAGMTAVICQWIAGRCAEPIEDMLDLVMRARKVLPFR